MNIINKYGIFLIFAIFFNYKSIMFKYLKEFIHKIFYFLKLILKSKKTYFKPKNKDFLILDKMHIQILEKYIGKNNFNILKIRGEETNLFVLAHSILNLDFKNLSLSYINSYIKLTNAKYCISFNHARIDFYKIKNFNKNIKIIIFQNGAMRLRFPNQLFVKNLKENNQKVEKNKLSADYIFCCNDFYKDKLFKKYINSKFINIGSYRNNYYFKKEKIKKKKSKKFISQFRLHEVHRNFKSNEKFYDTEKKLLPMLYKYCKKHNLKLEILGAEWDIKKEKNFYKKILGNDDWDFYKRTLKNKSYYLTDQAQIVVFVDSNLGLESLSRGNKSVSINYRGLFHKSYQNFGYDFLKNKGNFWTTYSGAKEFKRLMNYASNCSKKKWDKDNSKIIKKILEYDPKNTKFKKLLKNIV